MKDDAKVDHREGDEMSGQEIASAPIEANEQRPELVDPGKGTLSTETQLVNLRVKPAFWAGFGTFAIAHVVRDVWDQAVVEARFARQAGVKGSIGIEERAANANAQVLDRLEGGLEVGRQFPGVVVVAREDAGRGKDEAVAVSDRQDVAGLGAFAALVGHGFTAFLGQRVAAIEIEIGRVKSIPDHVDTVFPHAFQAAVAAPLAKVVIHRIPTDLFFDASFGSGSIGSFFH